MDEIKIISSLDFSDVKSKHPFQNELFVKDYYISLILYLIKDIEGIYFKGGTALNKIFLNHARLSEDIDVEVFDKPRTSVRETFRASKSPQKKHKDFLILQ